MNAQVVQPLHQMPAVIGGETASSAVAAQARALVEARYTIAIKYPRDLDQVREKLMKECRRPSFAKVARYRKPIGAGIEGPSIRFAEAALRCMTNITVETMTVYDDREKRIVRVAVTDLEANLPYSLDVTIEKTVERRTVKSGDVVIRTRLNSRSETVHLIEATEDDILNKQNALISKAIRTQGLRIVPGDMIDEGMEIVKKTQRTEDAKDPDAAKRALFDAFGEVGVRTEQLKDYLGHGGETLDPKELADLRGLYAAIRDGETTWREVMEAKAEKDAAKKPVDKIAPKGGAAGLKNAVDKKPSPPPAADPGTGEITAGEIRAAIEAASTKDALDSAADGIRFLNSAEDRTSLSALVRTREDELSLQS